MGYAGQQLFKKSPWVTFVIWCVLIGYICATCVTRDNFWWVLPLAIAFLVGTFFSCRTQARINKKMREQNKSISNVSWTENIQMHLDEMINSNDEKTNKTDDDC